MSPQKTEGFLTGAQWGYPIDAKLTYSIDPGLPSALNVSNAVSIVENSANAWTGVGIWQFTRVPFSDGNDVSYRNFSTGSYCNALPSTIAVTCNPLNTTFYPTSTKFPIYFNSSTYHTYNGGAFNNPSARNWSIDWIVTHEFGHYFVLDHTRSPSCVILFMCVGLTQDVIRAAIFPSNNTVATTVPWYSELPAPARALEETKVAYDTQIQATATSQVVQGKLVPSPTPLIFSESGVYPITKGIRPAGDGFILEEGLNLYFRKGFDVSNVWYRDIDGSQLIVYAGRDQDTPMQGGLFVQWGLPGESSRPNAFYPAPLGFAKIRITDASGMILQLVDSNGKTTSFDIIAGLYTGQNVSPTPATPIPSPISPGAYPAPAESESVVSEP